MSYIKRLAGWASRWSPASLFCSTGSLALAGLLILPGSTPGKLILGQSGWILVMGLAGAGQAIARGPIFPFRLSRIVGCLTAYSGLVAGEAINAGFSGPWVGQVLAEALSLPAGSATATVGLVAAGLGLGLPLWGGRKWPDLLEKWGEAIEEAGFKALTLARPRPQAISHAPQGPVATSLPKQEAPPPRQPMMESTVSLDVPSSTATAQSDTRPAAPDADETIARHGLRANTDNVRRHDVENQRAPASSGHVAPTPSRKERSPQGSPEDQVAADRAWIQENLERRLRSRAAGRTTPPPRRTSEPPSEMMDVGEIHQRLMKIHGGRIPGDSRRHIPQQSNPRLAAPLPPVTAVEPTLVRPHQGRPVSPPPPAPVRPSGYPAPSAPTSRPNQAATPPGTGSTTTAAAPLVTPVLAATAQVAPKLPATPVRPASEVPKSPSTSPAPITRPAIAAPQIQPGEKKEPCAPPLTSQPPAVAAFSAPAAAPLEKAVDTASVAQESLTSAKAAPTPVNRGLPEEIAIKPVVVPEPILPPPVMETATLAVTATAPVLMSPPLPDNDPPWDLGDDEFASLTVATADEPTMELGAASVDAIDPGASDVGAVTQVSWNEPREFAEHDLPAPPTEEIGMESVPTAPESESADNFIIAAPADEVQFLEPPEPEYPPSRHSWENYAPPLDLLQAPNASHEPVNQDHLARQGRLIEEKLAEFKVKVAVQDAFAGPVITRYEVEPAVGVRGAQVVNLMKDLSRALGVTSIRVVETIPGKTYMGLELPNPRREMIRLSEVLSSDIFQYHGSKLAMVLGKDIIGNPVVADLAKAPHMLVAGTTGSGKSVGVNAMILSLLYRATPDEVRFVMIDPKMLELSVYDGIPHLLAPVVTDMKLAANALNWCVGEMERRYRLMSALGVRNLAGFNQKVAQARDTGRPIVDPFPLVPESPTPLEPLPFIVVVVDEFADLMMVAGKKIEELIARLAQKARAAGIHLILATQRPSVDVITGLIKANIPTRIAFQVSSKVDSRTILDQMGAETLLGQGDMLYLPPGTGYPQRVHGAFVADEEVHALAEHLKQYGEPDYVEAVLGGAAEEEQGETEGTTEELDPLYDQAVAIVINSRRASISLIQRHLRIGYNRAARLVEQMEVSGVVSPMESNGNRTVLVPAS